MKTTYRGIDLGKMLSAILVVSIHAQLFYGNSIYSAYSFYISSVAVPFFFMVSGFLLERKIEDNNFENIRFAISNRIKNLFVPYLFWGILYFSLSIAIAVFLDGSTFFSALSLQFHKLLVSSPGGGTLVLSELDINILCSIYSIFWR